MTQWKLFLDLDGVLVDFYKGVYKLHNLPDPYEQKENLGIYEAQQVWGMSPQEFWTPLNHKGFWENLEQMPEAREIVELVSDMVGPENVAILTSPNLYHWCVPEKRGWIKLYYPQFSDRMIFGSAKHFLAAGDKILVDDRDKNIEDFTKAGGYGVIVPRPWNSQYEQRYNVIDALEKGLFSVINAI